MTGSLPLTRTFSASTARSPPLSEKAGFPQPAHEAPSSAKSAFIPQVVQVELCWLLESSFGLRHAEIVKAMRVLQGNPRIELEHRKAFDATLDRFARDAAWGFADCLIATLAAQHDSQVLTFDKRLARLSGATVLALGSQRSRPSK